MSWALRQAPSDGFGPKLMLLVLANHADKDGVTVVGRQLLAEECGTKRPATITEIFGRLEREGLIRRVERRRGNGSRTSDWTVLAPEAVDRGEMIDSSCDSGQIERPEDVVVIARRGTDTGSDRGTGSGPVDGEAGTVSETVRSGESKGQVRSASRPEPSVDPTEDPRIEPTASLQSRRELVELSNLLAGGILQNDPKAKLKPESDAWLDPLRKLIDLDGRPAGEVRQVIEWVLADEFEHKVVLSPGKLRERYTQLRMKANLPAETRLTFRRRDHPLAVPAAVPIRPEVLDPTDEERELWAEVAARIRAGLKEAGDGVLWGMWFADLHVHGSQDGALVLGAPARSVSWVADRFGKLLATAAGRQVQIVACGCDTVERAA